MDDKLEQDRYLKYLQIVPWFFTCIVGTGGIPLDEFFNRSVSAWCSELTRR